MSRLKRKTRVAYLIQPRQGANSITCLRPNDTNNTNHTKPNQTKPNTPAANSNTPPLVGCCRMFAVPTWQTTAQPALHKRCAICWSAVSMPDHIKPNHVPQFSLPSLNVLSQTGLAQTMPQAKQSSFSSSKPNYVIASRSNQTRWEFALKRASI